MKKMFLFLVSMIVSVAASAAASDYGVIAGFRSQSGDVTDTTVSTSSGTGYQLGLTASFPLSGDLNFRTGFMYVERPIKISVTAAPTNTADIKLTYFDLPATLSYKVADYAAIYGGLIIGMNLSKTYSGTGVFATGTVTDVKSMITPIVLGAAFRFAPQIGADVFFESFGSDMASGYKNYRAVGANFVYYLD
jgi:hypothetical protein